MIRKNDLITLTIASVTNQGSGVGRHEGMAVFVPMTAPGDVAAVKIVKVLSSYCYGIVEELLTPSPLRIRQDCPAYQRCGGCSLRHMTYEGELAAKEGWVADAFRRIGGISAPAEPILPSPLTEGYRNKAQYPIAMGPSGAYCGFFAPRTHTVIPAMDCRLQPPFFADIARAVCGYIDQSGKPVYDEATGAGLFRHLYIRWGEATGQVMVCLVCSGQVIPQPSLLVEALQKACPQITSILVNVNAQRTNVILGEETKVLYGTGKIEDVLRGVRVSLSPLSFYQVNRRGAELLYAAAEKLAGLCPTDLLLDLYCGTGTIGLSMAGKVREVIGVEVSASAVADAAENARRGGIGNARFLCADAGEAAARLSAEGLRPDVVILDPPRRGCDRPTLAAVAKMAPSRIVMVSCDPATAARDVKLLGESGYLAQKICPVDLFPRTNHVECVVLMTRTGVS